LLFAYEDINIIYGFLKPILRPLPRERSALRKPRDKVNWLVINLARRIAAWEDQPVCWEQKAMKAPVAPANSAPENMGARMRPRNDSQPTSAMRRKAVSSGALCNSIPDQVYSPNAQ
jgi:hypothetical protein